MGDLNNNTIQQVWSSGKYLNIRAEMKKNGRKNLMLCNKCDQVGGSFQQANFLNAYRLHAYFFVLCSGACIICIGDFQNITIKQQVVIKREQYSI